MRYIAAAPHGPVSAKTLQFQLLSPKLRLGFDESENRDVLLFENV